MAIEAWFMDESDDDQRLPHKKDPSEDVCLDHLTDIGVLYWRLNPQDYENDVQLKNIRPNRGYTYMLMRLSVGEPVWTPYNRPQEDHPARKGYTYSFFTQKLRLPLEAN